MELTPDRLPASKAVVRDFAGTFLTALGGDQHDTIGSLRSVDSSRSCIFQHVDTFDIGRIQCGNVTAYTIYKIKRLRITHRTQTADSDTHAGTGLPGGRNDVHTRCLSLQGRQRVGGIQLGNIVAFHLNRGAGHKFLFLHTVTDDDYFVQNLAVFFQYHIDDGRRTDLNFLRLIADVREYQRLPLSDIYRIVTVDICDATRSDNFFHPHADTNQRLVIHTRRHRSRDGLFLRRISLKAADCRHEQ